MKKSVLLLSLLIAVIALNAQVLQHWTQNTAGFTMAQNTTDVTDGTYSVAVTWTSQDTQTLRSDNFTVTGGSSYTITIDVLDNTNAGRTRCGLGFGTAGINWNDFNTYSADQATFQTLTFSGTVPEGETTGYVEVRFYDVAANWAGSAMNIIDNITVTLDGGSNLVVNGSFEDWGNSEPTAYTIQQIQDTTGTGNGASIHAGEYVITTGIITAIYGETFTMQSGTGVFSGIWVQNNATIVAVGDEVEVTGAVQESFGKTVLIASQIDITGQPGTEILPAEISTLLANDEGYEGVFVVCTGTCDNENPDAKSTKADYNEWSINDGSGSVRVDDFALDSPFEPTLGNEYEVTGILDFTFSNFKIQPRDINDIVLIGAGTDPIMSITSPANGSTVNSADVNIVFTVLNFDVANGTADGHIQYTLDGGAVTPLYTTDPIALTGLSEAEHTVAMELVDNSNNPLDPPVTATVSFTVDLGTIPGYTTIYEIQYTTDASGNSPLIDTEVTTRGVVVAKNSDKFWIQDGAGAWNGVYVYYTTTPSPAIGDSVIVTATVVEYNNLTELSSPTYTVVNTGNTIAAPAVVATGDAGSEMYEGVLIQVEGVNNTAPDNYGQWPVNDGSGDILVDDLIFDYTPVQGNSYRVTGVLDFSFAEWKIQPRSAEDIVDLGVNTQPTLYINSPENGSTIYTASTNFGFTVSNFTLGTDGKVEYILDSQTPVYVTTSPSAITGLTNGEHTIVAQLVDMSENPLNPAVTATITFTVNLSGPTLTSIYDIQYTDQASGASPLENQTVSIKGVVSAVFNGTPYGEGYYLQQGSGAWNGLFIYDLNNTPALGDSVLVTGKVSEYYEMTELTNITLFQVTGIGGTIANPTVVSTLDANTEMYESVLLKVMNAECTAVQNTYGQWTVDDGTGALLCQDNGAFSFEETLGTHYNIIGVTIYSYEETSLNYRIPSDIVESTSIETNLSNSTLIFPNPANNLITISANEKLTNLNIVSAEGKTVMTISPDSRDVTIDISQLSSGFYFIHLEGQYQKGVKKLIVE